MRGRATLGAVIGCALVSACVPSRESRSAGEVGCSPDEISISDEQTQFGLLQSGETWVASCRGRTFICSQMNDAAAQRGTLGGASFASQQVSCHEEAESPEEQRNREARESARAANAAKPPSAAPSGAAGFELGQSFAEAQQRCEASGHQWSATSSDAPRCSGPAAEIGIPVQVALRFCAGRECVISIEHRPTGDWSSSVLSLKAQLEAKYGSPRETGGPIPENCRSADSFARCLESNALALHYGWRWGTGEALDMNVGKPSAQEGLSIRLVYSRAAGTANAAAL